MGSLGCTAVVMTLTLPCDTSDTAHHMELGSVTGLGKPYWLRNDYQLWGATSLLPIVPVVDED